MKIKLNVTKELKRKLKVKAKEFELDRNDYIYETINKLVEEKKAVWEPKIEGIMMHTEENSVEGEVKAKDDMKKTTKKMQPIILNVDEQIFYALAIVAKKNKSSKEDMLVNYLERLIKF